MSEQSREPSATTDQRGLRSRAERYLAAPGDGDARRLRTEIDRHAGIRLLRLIESATPAFPALTVIEGTAQDVALLAERTGALIEPDQPLRYGAPAGYAVSDPTALSILPDAVYETVVVEARDEDGRAVPDAAVHVIDHDYPARAVTGPEGRAELRIPGQVCDSATALIVQAARDHWSTQVHRPALNTADTNTVICQRLGATRRDGSVRAVTGDWPRYILGLDHMTAGSLGTGARLALIDSGADLDHPDLADANVSGYDLIGRDEKSWRTDLLGTGTATASLLVGAGAAGGDGLGVTGVCHDAELHALKVMPGGRTSDLIEAVDYCIDHGIDVASVSVGAPGASAMLAAKLQQAYAAGVCMIAAAGDQPDVLSYPAALPGVLAVGALGRSGTFPAESHHAARMTTSPGPDGFFIAGCTPSGPLVHLYAPGVAVLSAVPGGGYTARDGTALAAAQVAGIAALITAHHPALRERAVRGAARAQQLARLLLAATRPIQTGPVGETVPVPDGTQAIGGNPAPGAAIGMAGTSPTASTALSAHH